MPGHCVVGLQWGDEAKGKLVDWMTEGRDLVVRPALGAAVSRSTAFAAAAAVRSAVRTAIGRSAARAGFDLHRGIAAISRSEYLIAEHEIDDEPNSDDQTTDNESHARTAAA